MALFNDLIGDVVSAVAGDKAPALNAFLQANGGVSGLASKFQNGGAGEVFASWVSTGDNRAVTTETINQVWAAPRCSSSPRSSASIRSRPRG